MAGEATKAIDKEVLWGGGRSPFSTSYGKQMMWFFLVSDALTFGGLLVGYGALRHNYTGQWPIADEVFHHFPLMGDTHMPLIYVALMTFILIVSSVTMVLAVETGHRNDRKGVTRWMLATVLGGFVFLGSQAWEWSHFIHGSHFGKIMLEDGSWAKVDGNADTHEIAKFTVIETAEHGAKYTLGQEITQNVGEIYHDIQHHHPEKIIHGANMSQNEYGPQVYANFFFGITGFHGFHVFSGVIINLIIFIGVLKGTYHNRGHYEMVEKVGLYWHFVDLVWVFVFTFFYLV